MKYRRLYGKEKANAKISRIKDKQMKKMRKEGYTYHQIADKFNVSQRTAWMHTAPKEMVEVSRNKRNKATSKRNKKKYANDINFKRKALAANARYKKKSKNN